MLLKNSNYNNNIALNEIFQIIMEGEPSTKVLIPNILNMIFKYLDPISLRAVREVCGLWNNIASRPNFRKRYKMEVDENNIENVLGNTFFQGSPNLRVKASRLTQRQTLLLHRELSKMTIEKLVIEGAPNLLGNPPTGYKMVSSSILGMIATQAKMIQLINVPSRQLLYMINIMADLIETLDLEVFMITNGSAINVDIPKLTRVVFSTRVVNLGGLKIRKEDAPRLFRGMTACHHWKLATLNMCGVNLMNVEGLLLSTVVKRLTAIDISKTNLSVNACRTFFRGMSGEHQVQALRICQVESIKQLTAKEIMNGIKGIKTVIFIEPRGGEMYNQSSITTEQSYEIAMWLRDAVGRHGIRTISIWRSPRFDMPQCIPGVLQLVLTNLRNLQFYNEY